MLKSLQLIQILAVTTIIILLLVIIMQTYVNSMTKSVGDDIYTSTMEVSDITYLKNGMTLITGKDKDDSFYKIYGPNSVLIDEGALSHPDHNLHIDDIAVNGNTFTLICNAKLGSKSKGIVFTYDLINRTIEKNELPTLPETKDVSFFVSGNDYFAACKKNVYLLDGDSNKYTEFPLSNVYKINDICSFDNKVYIVGQKAVNQTLQNGKNAFYASYTRSGELVWEYNTLEKVNSTIEKIVPTNNENFVLHGLYTENLDFSVEYCKNSLVNTEDDKVSSFVLYIDKDGKIITSNVYKPEDIFLKKVVGISKYDRVMGYGAYILDPNQSKYIYSLNLINRELANISRLSFQSDLDLVYYVTGNDDIGVFALIHINGTGNYRLKHYSSNSEFITEMKLLNSLRNAIKYVGNHVTSIIYAYISVATCYILKIKYSRGNKNVKVL